MICIGKTKCTSEKGLFTSPLLFYYAYVHVTVYTSRIKKALKDISRGKVRKNAQSFYLSYNKCFRMDNPFCSTVIAHVRLKKFGFILLFSVTRSNKHHEFLRVMNRTRLLGREFTKLYIMGHVQLSDFRCCSCGIT